ncbi:MAG: phospholipase C, phosphocholine-specific [Mucilaginibacter polytrichastri]|nr:phospholipase C, phosphocholine-specific [Mucilaginibacter polytrichastri]
MNDSRRDFIKKATFLAGSALFPAAIQKAFAIEAAPGSTWADAEHVVFLMQENRSFDHAFGTLNGVRGFSDPRAIKLPNGNPVFLQESKKGETYAPFRLNLKDTKATWMNSLPHSWENQVDARNGGRHDGWLDSKRSGNTDFAHMPLTMGYYNREDIPFYYALADAFTICDQHFCSSLTGTSPNRLYFWTGSIRAEQKPGSRAHVWNDEIDHKELHWTTFPERLENAGVSWKIYQNELSIPVGFEGEQDDWLSNFTDNDMENFAQFHLRLHKKHLEYLEQKQAALEKSIPKTAPGEARTKLERELAELKAYRQEWNAERFEKLSAREKSLHNRAYVTNTADPDYHKLADVDYADNGTKRSMKVPAGDVLHQFRNDVHNGQLPAVSWLVPPAHFSDHPGSPWYGAWYLAEVMDILTKNPEVFRKTIFVVTYDENDGYFDHVPPFVPPDPADPHSGKASAALDLHSEFVTAEQEQARNFPKDLQRSSPIGLGYRVPMLVISPWTRGGWVNSQVFDHTSNLQFLERFIEKKTGKMIREDNITDWRRTVCGDLSSVFREATGEKENNPAMSDKSQYLETIHKAQFKKLPSGYTAFSPAQIEAIRRTGRSELLPAQEKGARRSCALPYELQAEGRLSADRSLFHLQFSAANTAFAEKAAGAPFRVQSAATKNAIRNYAVIAGDTVSDVFSLSDFPDGKYALEVLGPNGFYRQFSGDAHDPQLEIGTAFKRTKTGDQLLVSLKNTGEKGIDVQLRDASYGAAPVKKNIPKKASVTVEWPLAKSKGWYDLELRSAVQAGFLRRLAGRVENGEHGWSDPAIG